MTALQKASKRLTRLTMLRDRGGNLPEANQAINDASRAVIKTMRDTYGQAWLGRVNLYNTDDEALRQWGGETVYNFEAKFVLPGYDATVEQMIIGRHENEWAGRADYGLIKAIFERVSEIGGEILIWV